MTTDTFFGTAPRSPALQALHEAYQRRQSVVAAATAEGLVCKSCGALYDQYGCRDDLCMAREDAPCCPEHATSGRCGCRVPQRNPTGWVPGVGEDV